METVEERKHPLLGLFGDLRHEFALLIRQEIQLAKTEMTEKAAKFGRNAGLMAGGGVAAFVGLLVFVMGVGYLLTYAFQSAGLNPALAAFIGFCLIGLVIIGVGAALFFKAQKSLTGETVKPEKTIEALRMRTNGHAGGEEFAKPSSDELQARVVTTRTEVGQTLGQIRGRMTVARANQAIKRGISAHPASSILMGLACGVAGGVAMRSRGKKREENKKIIVVKKETED